MRVIKSKVNKGGLKFKNVRAILVIIKIKMSLLDFKS